MRCSLHADPHKTIVQTESERHVYNLYTLIVRILIWYVNLKGSIRPWGVPAVCESRLQTAPKPFSRCHQHFTTCFKPCKPHMKPYKQCIKPCQTPSQNLNPWTLSHIRSLIRIPKGPFLKPSWTEKSHWNFRLWPHRLAWASRLRFGNLLRLPCLLTSFRFSG